MLEKTFILIKPKYVGLANEILEQLDIYGKRIITAKIDAVPKNIIEDHYSPHKGKSFFKYMTESFAGKSVVIAIYEGKGIIQKISDFIGPTDPSKASKNTIRGKYSNDSLETAIAKQRPVENVIHRSDSIAEAKREISVWKQYLNGPAQI